jgi:hypothetical protein
MLDHAVMKSVAEQLMSGPEVVVDGRKFRVSRTGSRRFRTVRFSVGGAEHQAIEQNPEKPSRWGQLAGGASGGAVQGFADAEVCGGGGGWGGACVWPEVTSAAWALSDAIEESDSSFLLVDSLVVTFSGQNRDRG